MRGVCRRMSLALLAVAGAGIASGIPLREANAQRSAGASITIRSSPLAPIRTLSEVSPEHLSRTGDPGAPSVPAVAGQVAVGTLVTPIGYVGGGLATRWVAERLGADEDVARRVAYIGAYSGAALATAGAVELLGRTSRVSGSFPVTVGGAVAGELAAWGVVELGRALYSDGDGCNLICSALGVGAFMLPSVGATVGHALSREWR